MLRGWWWYAVRLSLMGEDGEENRPVNSLVETSAMMKKIVAKAIHDNSASGELTTPYGFTSPFSALSLSALGVCCMVGKGLT